MGMRLPIRARVSRVLWLLIDQVFPPVCAGCHAKGSAWCENCQKESDSMSGRVCDCCGKPNPKKNLCYYCLEVQPKYDGARSWGIYQGLLRDGLLELKYKRNLGLGEALAEHLKTRLFAEEWEVDMIVPIPLGRKRRKERGYNQAEILARPLSWQTGLPINSGAIIRQRETRSQVELSRKEREENVAGAFRAFPKEVDGKNILIVDDVMTTGATLNAAAAALKTAGAAKVYALTVGRAK